MRTVLAHTPIVVALLAALATAACSSDDAKSGPDGPTVTATAPSDTGSPSGDAFTARNYRYVLERSCYCAFTVPVTVTVRDGEVASAVALESNRSVQQGEPAPDTHRLTINDIIDIAEDPAQRAEVTWPDDQDWPDRVRTDRIEGTADDEITYEIRQVRVQ